MPAPPDPWLHVAAGGTLRPYQARALAELVPRLAAPTSGAVPPSGAAPPSSAASTSSATPHARACLVAPPGAGKTWVALHVAAALKRPIEVRAPTTALVRQWQDALDAVLVDVRDQPLAVPATLRTYAANAPFAPGALVLLDEAHHLCASWGRDILDALPEDAAVLGLTATPPYGHEGWDTFVTLVGADPVRIDAPPLVRSRHLAPYLDLVWPVLATAADVPALREADEALTAAERAADPHLLIHVDRRLREDLEQLTEDRFAGREDLLAALCRVATRHHRTLPLDLPPDPDFTAPPDGIDRARVLADWDRDHPAVRAALSAAGFRLSTKGVVPNPQSELRTLATSRSRLRGLIDVLEAEWRERTEWLRALVLTDRDVEGPRLSAREVLKAVARDPRVGHLDPILVTGTTFQVDSDVWEHVRDRAPDLPWEQHDDHHDVDVSRWSTAERVALATRLLEEGVTRCLVGTRHLLGEGWDCPAVNCVVDLTGIAASVTVNQVRGRALRKDPHDASKVASLWEILTLAPGLPGGGRMLERLAARHEHTLGLDAQGRIRAGVQRIDPVLTRPLPEVAADAEALKARMAGRLGERSDLAARWGVGADYRDRRVWRLEGRVPAEVPALQTPATPDDPTPAASTAWIRIREASTAKAGLAVIGGLLTGAGGAIAITALGGPLGAAALVATAGLGLGLGGSYHLGRARGSRRDAILRALHATLVDEELVSGPLRVDATRWWVDGSPEESRLFAEAAAALFAPPRYPRYVLLEGDGRLFAVPDALGRSRAAADRLEARWAELVGPAETLFARRGRGQELLRAAWRTRPDVHAAVEVVEDWE